MNRDTGSNQRKKEIPLPPHKFQPPCVKTTSQLERITPGKIPNYYNALPRDCKFAFMTPGFYATGFRILDVYKTEVDLTEIRRLMFLEDPKQVKKWGNLMQRVPYPEGRVTDLPGTSDMNYKNYNLRSLTPESAASWRKSLVKKSPAPQSITKKNEAEPDGS